MRFADRNDAGRRLGARLVRLRDEPAVVVLGLPRGGVPVAAQVAQALGAPLDVLVVRKLGVPFQPELAMGAIAEGGVRVLDDEVLRRSGVSARQLAAVEARERVELERRSALYRRGRPALPLSGRIAVVVDDGVATGSTARAACRAARARGAAHVVLAVPVAPVGWEAGIGGDADELVALETPDPFVAVGRFYADFSQTSDDEVVTALLRAAAGPTTMADLGTPPPVRHQEVVVEAGPIDLVGDLCVPDHATGLVLFAHGSGSGRHSPRNRYVAAELHRAGLATLLLDLLTPAEEHDRAKVFDVELLGRRLSQATAWARALPVTDALPVGYVGASTGAAAALGAAATPGSDIAAVVCRGGRPDLVIDRLAGVRAPTLLVVGSEDREVLDLNRRALARLACEKRLAVVHGATHLFEEPGTLAVAAGLAREWFTRHLAGARAQRSGAA